jgi:hypothetical protein
MESVYELSIIFSQKVCEPIFDQILVCWIIISSASMPWLLVAYTPDQFANIARLTLCESSLACDPPRGP